MWGIFWATRSSGNMKSQVEMSAHFLLNKHWCCSPNIQKKSVWSDWCLQRIYRPWSRAIGKPVIMNDGCSRRDFSMTWVFPHSFQDFQLSAAWPIYPIFFKAYFISLSWTEWVYETYLVWTCRVNLWACLWISVSLVLKKENEFLL